jgi:catechol 2,3-dioxygenase-like lactoylglutathione lyase family enzyme
MARVRYMVDDVDRAVEFYVSMLGFELDQQFGTAIAILNHGDLELLVAGPQTSAAKPMSDGRRPSPGGGWSRVDDLESVVGNLEGKGVTFLNDVVNRADANRFFVPTVPAT